VNRSAAGVKLAIGRECPQLRHIVALHPEHHVEVFRGFQPHRTTGSIARGGQITLILGAGMTMPAAVQPRLRVWYNSELKSKNYIIPGLIAVILMIISSLLTSLTIAREWEMGTMEQVLSTPLRPAELVLGKMSAYFALGLADALIAVCIGVFLFGVPMHGNPALLFLSTCIFLFGALCWGILISAIARSQVLACQMGIISSFLPAFLLSGFIFSIENMPAVVQAVTHILPARYFVTLLKAIFLKGIGVTLLWTELGFLALHAAGYPRLVRNLIWAETVSVILTCRLL
jgi:ABC-2 type transport system permease protein